MANKRRYTEDYGDVLRDGERKRVPMMLRDSANWRDPAGPLHVFAGDRLADGMHRPGFRTFHDSSQFAKRAREAKQQAYDEYDTAIESEYKTTGAGEHGSRGQQEGDLCTLNGAPGHLRKNAKGELVCIPDHDGDDIDRATSDSRDHQTCMADAYAAYDRELSSAWRNK